MNTDNKTKRGGTESAEVRREEFNFAFLCVLRVSAFFRHPCSSVFIRG